jgi:2-polyprenyl-6-methoxyphenol hydroxylase-like FAD-dependent oxidoreductase
MLRARAFPLSPSFHTMIIIAGAGIGGLTLGCALSRAGRSFRILERAAELRPVGAGIALSENALRALAHIGLAEAARAAGQELGTAAICDQRGEVLIGYRIRDIIPGATVAMARAALQQTLVDALGTHVHTGQEVVDYEHRTAGVRVRLASGETVEGDLLVGADGLHSAVRRVMRGQEPLRYSGYTSWRALVDDIDLADPDRFTESWGAGQRFGIVPIGNRRVYWFAVADAAAGDRGGGDTREDLRRRFAGWHAPIDRIIAATPRDQIIRTDIFDRVPIARWSDRRVVLLGDAAHPMTPNLGMGGCQAIEDAVVLNDALGREASIDTALARYESRRIPRANSFVVRSFRAGQIAQLRAAPLRWLRNRALRAVPIRLATRAMARDMDFRL